MAGEWKRHEVSQLMQDGKLVIGDGYRAKNDELAASGLPFARAANINGGFRFDDADHFPEDNLARVRNKISQPGDVVFTSKGTVGRFAFVRPTTPRFVYSPQLCFWRSLDHATLYPRFLYYWMLGGEFFVQFKGVAGQTDMAEYVSLTDQRRMHITLPPLAEQRAIAHILGTLDDKIELNRRMNETLEAMVRALFKSWFVDFLPVRAKMAARTQTGDPLPASTGQAGVRAKCRGGSRTAPTEAGLPKPIADLFPARLVDSELGEIPEGWRSSKLGREVVTVLGGTPSRTEPTYWGGDIPWINSGKANEFRVVEPSEFITQEGLASSATKLLPSRTTVIAITGATLGQISLAEIETCANQSIVGVLGTATLPSEFIYFWTKEHVEDLLAWQTGGAQQHINKNNVNDLPVLCPSESAVAAYLAVARPAFDRIKACCNESLALAALRDTLLPKLISGELRAKDAERLLEVQP